MKKILVLALAAIGVSANAVITIGASNVAFVDISVSGNTIASTDDSENNILGTALTAAGWGGNALLAGGVDVRVGNNGAVIWNPNGAQEIGWANSNPTNTTNPSIAGMGAGVLFSDTVNGNGNAATGARQFLAVLWDDNTPGTGGSIKWQVIGGDLIIQWTNEDHFNATGAGVITYEMIARGSGSNLVDYVYNDTLYAASQYQDDGGSATIGYKNWGVNAFGNDVEYGIGGGSGNTTTDPAFGDPSMQAKVSGWTASNNGNLTHSVTIAGPVPEPASMTALGLGALALIRRRRSKKA